MPYQCLDEFECKIWFRPESLFPITAKRIQADNTAIPNPPLGNWG